MSLIFSNPNHKQFIDEAEEAGFKVVEYQHKAIDKFPAIIVGALEDINGKISVETQYNKIGTAFVIFPK